MNDMTRVNVLQETLGNKWEVKQGSRDVLVDVEGGALLICVDGRPIIGGGMGNKDVRGPKVQGGTLGIALLLAHRDGKNINAEVFRQACQMTVDSGFLPGVHDMSGEHGVHCGHCKLMMEEFFGEGDPKLEVSPEEMVNIVFEFGGREVKLEGEHQEQVVRLNYVADTTIEPNYDGFALDVWWVESLGLDVNYLLENAANTVVGLNGKTEIEVIE